MPKGQLSRVPSPGNSWMPFTFQPALQMLQQPHKHSHSLQQAIHTCLFRLLPWENVKRSTTLIHCMWHHLINYSWEKLRNFVTAVFPVFTPVMTGLYHLCILAGIEPNKAIVPICKKALLLVKSLDRSIKQECKNSPDNLIAFSHQTSF